MIRTDNYSTPPDALNGTYWGYDYHPSEVSQGSYLFDSFNANVPTDLGYHTFWDYVKRSSTSYDYNQYIVMPGLGVWFTSSDGSGKMSRSGFFSSSGGPWIWQYSSTGLINTVSLGMNEGNHVVLKSGQRYLFNAKIVVADTFAIWNYELSGNVNIIDTFVNGTQDYYVLFEPTQDVSTNSIRFNMNTFTHAPTSSFQVWSFGFSSVIDTDSIEEAIRDQTNDLNKNHDETMDKIDDVTDFDSQEQSDLTGAVDGASDQINEKLGILSFGDHVLDQFIGIFDAAVGSPGITLPGFSIEVDGVQHVVWTDQVFDLSSIEDKFGPLMTAVHFATSFLVYAALVMYVQKIFGAIMQDWSDK